MPFSLAAEAVRTSMHLAQTQSSLAIPLGRAILLAKGIGVAAPPAFWRHSTKEVGDEE